MGSEGGKRATYDMSTVPFLFAGDRVIGVSALDLVIRHGTVPSVLCVPSRASHADELVSRFSEAGGRDVIRGSQLREAETIARLRGLGLEFALSVHFPEIVREDALTAPRRGWLNLHPAYLPYNRGWHTPTWALLDGTPIGATIHLMVTAVDAGPILARVRVLPRPEETAHALYTRILGAELGLLRDEWPRIVSGDWRLQENPVSEGTEHARVDLERSGVRFLDLDQHVTIGELLNRLRALTTSDAAEAAYFHHDGASYLVRIDIQRATEDDDSGRSGDAG